MKPKVRLDLFITVEQKDRLERLSAESAESIATHIRRFIDEGFERLDKRQERAQRMRHPVPEEPK